MWYRLLLLAFPSRIRREFGEDMARMFEAQRRVARSNGESLTRLWLRAIGDALVYGTAERMSTIRTGLRSGVGELRRWRWWMHALVQDLRYALRLLARQPGVTLVALLTLALGIGANTAIFSAVDAVLLRPLPYDEPERIMMVWEKRPTEGVLDNVVAPADFVDWRHLNTSFEAMAAMMPTTVDLTESGEPVRLPAGVVSPPFFDVLHVRPALGRTFREDEAIAGNNRVVILNHGLWQRRFGSNPDIVGQKIILNGAPFEVVGVLPATFEFPDSELELWSPLPLEGLSQPLSRSLHQFSVYARLKPGTTLQQARADMDRVGADLSKQYPDTNRTHGAWVTPLSEDLTKQVKSGLLLLLGAVTFVLLIACVNVANLLLAKAAGRRREIAVRSALGAGRWRLAGQTLTESLLLGLLGGAAGLLVAHWGIGVLKQLAPRGAPVFAMEHLGLDPRVLAFTLLLSIGTGLLFGLLPAWQLARQNTNDVLKEGLRSGGAIRRRLRVALVVSEIALASLLLVGAGLTLRSFQTLLNSDAGFAGDRVLTARVSLPGTRYREDAQILSAFDRIEQRLRAIPGVRAVGSTSHLPLSGQNARIGVAIEGREPKPDEPTRAAPRGVTPEYFRAMGITLKGGRGFTAQDAVDSPKVAIVNETMARRYWPDAVPIGRRVRLGGTDTWMEVVGVVGDVRHWGLDVPVNPEIYMPAAQYPWRALNLAIAADVEPAGLASAVRQQLKEIDPALPLSNVLTMNEVASRSMASRRAVMLLLAIFSVLALVLAAAGIYGVMAHIVALRTSEIGVRMTLGARPADVMRLVLGEGLVQALIGLVIGVGGAVLLMRWLRTLLFEVSPTDPLTLLAVMVVLLATALAACVVPARRAMRVDPVTALRN
jgi:putative ABC transport system permease protein